MGARSLRIALALRPLAACALLLVLASCRVGSLIGTPASEEPVPSPVPRVAPAPSTQAARDAEGVRPPPAPPEPTDPFAAPTGRVYYVSDCGPGADPDCVPGRDDNSGRDPASPWRSYEKARREFARLGAGDAIAFARGGVFPHAGRHRWNNAACRATAPCFVMDYEPPWASGDEPKPRILGGSYGFDLSNAGDPRHHEGYVLRNLVISGDADAEGRRWGIFLYNDVDDVLLEGLVVEGFGIGVHLSSGKGDAHCERVVLRDSRIADNGKQGWLGGGPGLRIEDSHFENNGFDSSTEHAAIRHHNLYLSDHSSGVVIRGNTLHGSSLYDDDRNPATPPLCYGTSLVVHGVHRDLVIEDNHVYETHASRRCWGISIDGGRGRDAFEGLVLRGNRVVDVGAMALGCTSCSDALIEGNVVVQRRRGFEAYGIVVPTKQRPMVDGPTADVRVRDNTLHFAGGDAVALQVGEEGMGFEIVGNAVAHTGRGRLVCLAVDTLEAGYRRIDRNTCHHVRPKSAVWVEDGGERLDLATWQKRSGFDAESTVAPPERDALELVKRARAGPAAPRPAR